MNFIMRAFVQLKRNSGKSIVLFALLFLLGTLMSGAISIHLAMHQTDLNVRSRIPAVFTLEFDSARHDLAQLERGKIIPMERLTVSEIEQIGAVPYVDNVDFSLSALSWLYSRELRMSWESLPEMLRGDDWFPGLTGLDVQTFRVFGVSSPRLVEMSEGIIELVEGDGFTESHIAKGSHVALISRELARLNNLQVGSFVTLENNLYAHDFDALRKGLENDEWLLNDVYELEIVGIYDIVREFNWEDPWIRVSWNQLVNGFRIPNLLVEEMIVSRFEAEYELLGSWYSEPWIEFIPIFSLYDFRDKEAFLEAAAPLLPEFWNLSDLSPTFHYLSVALDHLTWIADWILWVSIGAAVAVTILLLLLSMRDRQQEWGIYLALGEKKGKIIAQLLLEVLFLSAVALTLALLVGNVFSRLLSEQLVENQIVQQQEAFEATSESINGFPNQDFQVPFGLHRLSPGPMTIEDMIEAFEVSFTLAVIFQFYIVGLGTVLLATVAPLIFVLRLNPKKILM